MTWRDAVFIRILFLIAAFFCDRPEVKAELVAIRNHIQNAEAKEMRG